MQLPIIDISTIDTANDNVRYKVAKELDRICSTIGFFQIIGHAVPSELIAATATSARDFFSRPLEEKIRVSQPTPRTIRGYISKGRGALAYTRANQSPPDYKQSFSIGPPPAESTGLDVQMSQTRHYEVNRWPNRPRHFQSNCSAYYEAMEALSLQVLRLIARAMGVEDARLEQTLHNHVSVLGLAHYPVQDEPAEPGQLRCGAHSDFGTLTILWPEQRSTGLEVLDKRGRWRSVFARDDAFVVNIGDVLEHWTGGRWRSTMHRVVNPTAEDSRLDRLSLGYFQHPNPNTSMTSLFASAEPACARGDIVNTFGTYLDAKFSSQVRSTE
jgi:isopenicillin N synthase-like dioxygenase